MTCIAVKEDRHQNIMSSVVLFINSLGYKEITLKSDTEPAIMAFRNRVAEDCNAEVTLEDAVQGDKPPNGSAGNAVMLLRGVIRTIKCHVESCTQEEIGADSPILPLEHAGGILTEESRPLNRKNPRYKFGVAVSEKQRCRVLRGDGRRCIQSA